ncbi:hypothetical protein U1Q18_038193 [Sarracenia purpurea var. burkii]
MQKSPKSKQKANKSESLSTEYGSTEGGTRRRDNNSGETNPVSVTGAPSEAESMPNPVMLGQQEIQKETKSIISENIQKKRILGRRDPISATEHRSKAIFGMDGNPEFWWCDWKLCSRLRKWISDYERWTEF